MTNNDYQMEDFFSESDILSIYLLTVTSVSTS